ncbi:hypothetical protein [Nonomuraea pusilla]|uniref:hypothetical protein n=1 Tax=Nonomuraea pusilla TaxID=46177 RepID=UPI00210A0DA3|nr:hypothetical protein [Nonomuraea pusilla]
MEAGAVEAGAVEAGAVEAGAVEAGAVEVAGLEAEGVAVAGVEAGVVGVEVLWVEGVAVGWSVQRGLSGGSGHGRSAVSCSPGCSPPDGVSRAPSDGRVIPWGSVSSAWRPPGLAASWPWP